jgi:hypothetical protein
VLLCHTILLFFINIYDTTADVSTSLITGKKTIAHQTQYRVFEIETEYLKDLAHYHVK